MKKYLIRIIPHAEQRYNTPADYTTDRKGLTTVSVSKEIGSDVSVMGVALHELIESFLCKKEGITESEIDAWDMAFASLSDGDEYAEPGDHPDAPYHHQHKFALEMEKRFIQQCGEDWERHDARVLSVCNE